MLKFLIAVLIIGILAGGAFFFKDYKGQSAAADNMTAQIETDKKALTRISKQTQELNVEIASITKSIGEIENAINSENGTVPNEVDSNEIIRNILVLGEKNQIIIIPLSAQEWADVTISGREYSVFRMSLKVSGDQEPILNFVRDLSALYDTLIIESLSLRNKPVEEQSGGGVEGELSLAMYAK